MHQPGLVWKWALAAVVFVAGAVLASLGVLKQTVWAPQENLTVVATPTAPQVAMVVEPGVLQGYPGVSSVQVQAAEGEQVSFLWARETDVNAWLEGLPVARVTGFDELDRTKFTVQEADGSATGTVTNPADADIWVQRWTEPGSITFEPPVEDGRWLLVAMTDGTTGPTTMNATWPMDTHVPEAAPMVVFGASMVLLSLIAAGFLVWNGRRYALLNKPATGAQDAAPVTDPYLGDGTGSGLNDTVRGYDDYPGMNRHDSFTGESHSSDAYSGDGYGNAGFDDKENPR